MSTNFLKPDLSSGSKWRVNAAPWLGSLVCRGFFLVIEEILIVFDDIDGCIRYLVVENSQACYSRNIDNLLQVLSALAHGGLVNSVS